MCISRIPEDGSIIFPPSHCPKCNAKLRFFDLVPIISYMMLRGRCRYCKDTISPRYPIVEALTAILLLAIYIRWGISVDLAAQAVFASLLIVMAFIDIEHMVIPDDLVIAGIATGIAYSIYRADFPDSMLGICIGFLFMLALSSASKHILKKEALGDGDIKFVIMLGAFMGVEKAFYSLAAASLFGAVIGIALILFGRLRREDYIPFAPFLALASVVLILF